MIQYIITAVIVTAAVIYLGWYAGKLFVRRKNSCHKNCGCDTTAKTKKMA